MNGDIPPKVKNDAHAVILDFIRSRPPLRQVSSAHSLVNTRCLLSCRHGAQTEFAAFFLLVFLHLFLLFSIAARLFTVQGRVLQRKVLCRSGICVVHCKEIEIGYLIIKIPRLIDRFPRFPVDANFYVFPCL